MDPNLSEVIDELTEKKNRPGKVKEIMHTFWGYGLPSGIKRTRKRQIRKARFMNHGSYEHSQYWRKSYGKFRRNATRYSKKVGK